MVNFLGPAHRPPDSRLRNDVPGQRPPRAETARGGRLWTHPDGDHVLWHAEFGDAAPLRHGRLRGLHARPAVDRGPEGPPAQVLPPEIADLGTENPIEDYLTALRLLAAVADDVDVLTPVTAGFPTTRASAQRPGTQGLAARRVRVTITAARPETGHEQTPA